MTRNIKRGWVILDSVGRIDSTVFTTEREANAWASKRGNEKVRQVRVEILKNPTKKAKSKGVEKA